MKAPRLAACLALQACAQGAGPTAPKPAAAPESAAAAATTPKAAAATRDEKPSAAPATSSEAASARPEPAACSPAPPVDVKPPEARTAQPGDGAWTRFGDGARGDRAAGDPPLTYRTVLHPHPQSRFVTVTLAAVDRCLTRIGYVPGVQDVPTVAFAPARGLVPEPDRAELVAVFNGGYKPEHGRWGMFAAGTSLVPARSGGCTLSIAPGGEFRISSETPGADAALLAYRQTPPCLIENASLDPRLAKGQDKPWGGQAKDLVTRRRSALGVDAPGHYLFYAVGEEASPLYLAKALLAAGASAGAQLDINWYWTRFLLFGEKDGRLGVTNTLIDGMEFQPRSYVERASDRDFFYVVRRSSPP